MPKYFDDFRRAGEYYYPPMEQIIPIPGFTEPFSSISHLLAAVASFAGGIFLVRKGWGNAARVTSLIVYTFCLMFLFSMSGVYHLLDPGLGRIVLQRLDHAAIWCLIAGTFTPIHTILFRGVWRWGVLLFVWIVAINGIVLKSIYFDDIPEFLSVSLFLALGWVGALTAWKVVRFYGDRSLRLLLAGAASYTVGAILVSFQWPPTFMGIIGPHEVFHIFVIGGAASHWFWIYRFAHEPVFSSLCFIVQEYPDNMFVAKAQGESIRVTAHSREELKRLIFDAVDKLYHHKLKPSSIHLKFSKEEVIQI